MLDEPRYDALITAAGGSTRMGAAKALVPWRGVPLLRHQVRVLADVAACGGEPSFGAIVVVTGAHGDELAAAVATWPERARVTLVANARWAAGRSTSVEVGAAALDGRARGVLVVAVDQPLEGAVVEALVAAEVGAGEVLVPEHGGRRGHPLVVSGRLVPALREASRWPEGLRDVVRAARVRVVPVASAGIHLDLNTRDDLTAAAAGGATGATGETT